MKTVVFGANNRNPIERKKYLNEENSLHTSSEARNSSIDSVAPCYQIPRLFPFLGFASLDYLIFAPRLLPDGYKMVQLLTLGSLIYTTMTKG